MKSIALALALFAVPAWPQVDPAYLSIRPPESGSVSQHAIEAQRARRLYQEGELLRAQTEALKLDNERQKRALAAAASSDGSTPANSTDARGILNGRFWLDLNPPARLYFLLGILTGSQNESKLDSYFPPTLANNGELVSALNLFYSDPENLSIGVPVALILMTFRATTEEPEKYQKALSEIRKIESDAFAARMKGK